MQFLFRVQVDTDQYNHQIRLMDGAGIPYILWRSGWPSVVIEGRHGIYDLIARQVPKL